MQTFYPLGAIFETVHLEGPPPQKPNRGPLTTVKVIKETAKGPLRRLQVDLLSTPKGCIPPFPSPHGPGLGPHGLLQCCP